MNMRHDFTHALEAKPVLVKAGPERLKHLLGDSTDVSGWTFRETIFPKGTNFAGWTMRGANFIECDLQYCDFTGADVTGIVLDHSTIELGGSKARGLDLSRAAKIEALNPHEIIASVHSMKLPMRERKESIPFFDKLS